jgi:hypothetical protein
VFLVATAESFVGSLAAIAFWFHWDVEDHWRLWKVRRGKRLEDRARDRDRERRQALLDEERKREHEREYRGD